MKSSMTRTEKYLVSKDESLHEKLDLVKSKGSFFKTVLNLLDVSRQKCSYIFTQFHESANLLSQLCEGDKLSNSASEDMQEWSSLSSLLSGDGKHGQLKTACKSFENDVDVTFNSNNSAVIDFTKGELALSELGYDIGSSVVVFESAYDKLYYRIRSGTRLNATVHISNSKEYPEAYVQATDEDGKECFIQLEHFSILFNIDRGEDLSSRPQSSDNEGKMGIERLSSWDNRANDKTGVFVLFDRKEKVFYYTSF